MKSRPGSTFVVLAALAGPVWLAAQAPAPPPPPAPPDAVYRATRSNDIAQLRTLVKTKADANAKTPDGYTRLMDAAEVGSLEAVTYLLDTGADVNAQSMSGMNALMLADGDLSK